MAGYFHRLHPVDFALASTLGPIPFSTAVDWPIAYADLEPFYARAEREVGVSGVWHAHPFEEPRSADFPLPPLAENAFAKAIDWACDQLGYHAFPTPAPSSRAPTAVGRRACSGGTLRIVRLRDRRQKLELASLCRPRRPPGAAR